MGALADGPIEGAHDQRDVFLARIELPPAASRDPAPAELGDTLSAAGRRSIEFFLRVLTEGGADLAIETTAGLLDGLALHHATGSAPMPTADEIVSIVHGLLSITGECSARDAVRFAGPLSARPASRAAAAWPRSVTPSRRMSRGPGPGFVGCGRG